jgi:hypothetical protein
MFAFLTNKLKHDKRIINPLVPTEFQEFRPSSSNSSSGNSRRRQNVTLPLIVPQRSLTNASEREKLILCPGVPDLIKSAGRCKCRTKLKQRSKWNGRKGCYWKRKRPTERQQQASRRRQHMTLSLIVPQRSMTRASEREKLILRPEVPDLTKSARRCTCRTKLNQRSKWNGRKGCYWKRKKPTSMFKSMLGCLVVLLIHMTMSVP